MQNWSPGTAADRYNSVTPPSELINKKIFYKWIFRLLSFIRRQMIVSMARRESTTFIKPSYRRTGELKIHSVIFFFSYDQNP